jgi:hypothetical protein
MTRVTREIYGYQVHGQPQYTSCQTIAQVKRYVRTVGEREFELVGRGSAQRRPQVRVIAA